MASPLRLSARTRFETRENAISQAIRARRAAGPLLDLTVSNPTRAGLDYPARAILSAFADPTVMRYAPQSFGLESARAAVAETWAVDPGQVALTASTSEAYGMLFKVLCDPGDVVLAPEPSYPLFAHLAAFESVELRPYRLAYDGAWHIDTDHLRRQAVGARAVLVVHPNNPTGHFTSLSEQRVLAELGLPIISDEVFGDYAWNPPECPTLLPTPAPTFVLSGLSKAAGLPQMKAGWILMNELALAARDRLELVADTYLSIGTPVQLALPRLLDVRTQIADQIRARTRSNRETLISELAGSAATVLRADGGWYAVVELPRVRQEDAWVLALLGEGVVVQPGWFYDFEREGFVVLSLLTPSEPFRAGVQVLRELLSGTRPSARR